MKCIILSAGRGTRMQSNDTHKVCFYINGKPAIIQAMDRYSQAGLDDFTIVVGSMAEQVMSTVSAKFPAAKYAYQPQALGTGHAAKIGFECLSDDSSFMITMGDKIISPEVIKTLITQFEQSNLDLLFAVVPKTENKSGGNVVIDKTVQGIIEDLDVKKAQIYSELLIKINEGKPFSIDPYINDVVNNVITSERKRAVVLSQMDKIREFIKNNETDKAKISFKKGSKIALGDAVYEPNIISESKYVNAAVYLFKSKAFRYGLNTLTKDNANGELYLTDVVNVVCQNDNYTVNIYITENKNDILTYNNVNELIIIQDILSKDKKHNIISLDSYKSIEEWLKIFNDKSQKLLNIMNDIYGSNADLIEERICEYINVLEHFKAKFGSKKVIISRAPGRVNLMGRHVEHRGGCVNVISINKEVICVGAPNEQGLVRITNTSDLYNDSEFNIAGHFKDVTWKNWLDYLGHDKISKMLSENRGDWINYVKAPIIKLQYHYQDRKLSGMDLAYTGNIPVAAGLSSSSAIVVSTAEITVAVNNLDVKPQQFVDLCGEGEWFVGSRGGAGDHAAMKYGEKGNITSLGFFPFEYRESFPFPEGYKLIIANSFIKANKTMNAKDSFNQRIAAYEFGFMMIKDAYPQYYNQLKYLRDINPENLKVKQSDIYQIIKSLPEHVTQFELYDIISEGYHTEIDNIIKTHKMPDYYSIRSVMMYGIAECRRSFICAKLLKSGDFIKFGQMMGISHDGDRVYETKNDRNYAEPVNDEKIKSLIRALQSEDYNKVNNAQIENQPGGYACSTREIDYIIDIVNNIDGVIGSQLSGAGLGGCVMILVKDEAVKKVIKTLHEKYYKTNDIEDGITICIPVKGSGILAYNL